MANYTYNSSTTTRNSNASAENFTFDISSAITAAKIPAYAKVTKVTINVWGDIDTATSRGKMTASFGSTSLCSSIWAGGSAGEVSSGAKEITSYFNSENANAGKLKDSSVRLNVTLDGPVMIAKFNHTVRYQVYFEWTPHTHSYTTETSRTASTCCKKGSVTKKCSCGTTQTTELALDPNNHSGGTEVRNAKAATCTATGYTGDTYCKGCGAKLSSGSTIAKKAHTETTIPAVAPTCTEAGLTAGKKCSVCNTVITAQQTVAALGHSYSSVVTKPTGDLPGYTTHTCGNCAHSYADNYVYLPKFASVAMTYLGKQISATNKVPCGEGFIISVGVT